MAGRKQNIAPMWAALRAEGLDLEPSVPLNENLYLGCGQVEVLPDPVSISGKMDTFNRLCFSRPSGEPETAGGDPELLENFPEKTTKKKKNENEPQQEKPEENTGDQARAFATSTKPEVSAYMYEMQGHIDKMIDKYFELSGKQSINFPKFPHHA